MINQMYSAEFGLSAKGWMIPEKTSLETSYYEGKFGLAEDFRTIGSSTER